VLQGFSVPSEARLKRQCGRVSYYQW